MQKVLAAPVHFFQVSLVMLDVVDKVLQYKTVRVIFTLEHKETESKDVEESLRNAISKYRITLVQTVLL